MSQTKSQLVAPIGILTASGVSVAGIVTASNLNVSGVVTATNFIGNLTGNVTGVSTGLSGTPNINVGVVTAANFIGIGASFSNLVSNETRSITGSEKLIRSDGNTVSLVYNSSTGANVGFATNPTNNITLNVTGIPTSSDFDNQTVTFAVIVNNTGTARTCTSITLNGVSRTIKWIGGSLSAALAGVTTTNGYTIFSFTGINTVGSASTTSNYDVLGVVNGGFW